jgi:hypothetical protein
MSVLLSGRCGRAPHAGQLLLYLFVRLLGRRRTGKEVLGRPDPIRLLAALRIEHLRGDQPEPKVLPPLDLLVLLQERDELGQREAEELRRTEPELRTRRRPEGQERIYCVRFFRPARF